jgi:hypothetical protein
LLGTGCTLCYPHQLQLSRDCVPSYYPFILMYIQHCPHSTSDIKHCLMILDSTALFNLSEGLEKTPYAPRNRASTVAERPESLSLLPSRPEPGAAGGEAIHPHNAGHASLSVRHSPKKRLPLGNAPSPMPSLAVRRENGALAGADSRQAPHLALPQCNLQSGLSDCQLSQFSTGCGVDDLR